MRPAARTAASIVFVIAVLYAMLEWSGVSLGEVGRAATRVDATDLAAGMGLLLLVYAARAARIRAILPPASRPAFGRLAAASSAWMLDAQVLPARVGEATLIWHLRRLGVPAAEGFVALVLSRLLDLTVLLGAFGAAALALALGGGAAGPGAGAAEIQWLAPAGGILIACAVALGTLVSAGARAWRVVPAALARGAGSPSRWRARAHAFAVGVGEALEAAGPRTRWTAALWSVAVWAAILSFYAVLARGLGIELPLFGLVFGASAAVLGGLVPLSGFLGFGMPDVGWVAGFVALGVPRELAVESGLAFHVLYLVGIGVLGGLGHAVVARARRA